MEDIRRTSIGQDSQGIPELSLGNLESRDTPSTPGELREGYVDLEV